MNTVTVSSGSDRTTRRLDKSMMVFLLFSSVTASLPAHAKQAPGESGYLTFLTTKPNQTWAKFTPSLQNVAG